MIKLSSLFFSLFTLLFATFPAHALKTDQGQPATLDADEFDLDFQTGVRTYRGNVLYQQGSIRLYADEIVAYFKNDQLERVIARGNPAEFYQLPDNSDNEVVGVALRIEMDDQAQLVTLQDRAKVTQEANTLTGKKITYNMQTEKVKVRSGPRQKQKPRVSTKSVAVDSAPAEGTTSTEETGSSRPRLIIKPRN